MCGRFVLAGPPASYASYFSARIAPEVERSFRPSWNIPPTQMVLGVTADTEGQRELGRYRFGLVPSWAKDLSIGARTFNARAESVATKPAFRAAFKTRRILIPADAFYEWSHRPEELRQPYAFRRADEAPLAFAGLWELWRDRTRPEDEQIWVRSCTIITTAAGPDLQGLHDRQPVILEPDTFERWLDPTFQDRNELEALLRAGPPGTLACWRVGRSVGRVERNGPELLEPLTS